MCLQLYFVTYIRTFFNHCHLTLPYKEIFSFFGHCHVKFPYMEPLPFSGMFVQKVIVYLVFRIRLFRKQRSSQMAAVMLQVIPSFHTKYKSFEKQPLFFCKHV